MRTKGIDSTPIALSLFLLCGLCLTLAGIVAGCSGPTTRPTDPALDRQESTTSVTGVISEGKAVSIAKDYVELVYHREAVTAATMQGVDTTAPWVPVKIVVVSTDLYEQTSVSDPPPHEGLVWNIEMTTDRTTLTWSVGVDAVTGEVVDGGFAFSD